MGLGAIAFTGSRATGRRVAYDAAAAAFANGGDHHPTPPRMTLELGGKDAVYVRADVADPAAAAASIAAGAFGNAGQAGQFPYISPWTLCS